MTTSLKNWPSNYTFSTSQIHYPETLEQLQSLVKQSKKVSFFGARHSFSRVADSSETLLCLERMPQVLEIDSDQQTVTLNGGMKYRTLTPVLRQAGFAIHNLASLPHISVAGACTTATHGSGSQNKNLASAVSAIEFVTAEGDITTLSRAQDGDTFAGAVVNLGGLGVITKLTLDLMPTFEMRQTLFENMPAAHLDTDFEAIMGSAYSVSLFTDWRNKTIGQVWLKQRAEDSVPTEFYDATPATEDLHPLPGWPADGCTKQMSVPGPWYDRLPHFTNEVWSDVGNELQTEYFVAREHAPAVARVLSEMGELFAPHIYAGEVRTIAADDLWLSMCYQRDSTAFHFTWKPHWPEVQKILSQIEERIAPYEARPHWGKLTMMPFSAIQSLYPKLSDFQNLLTKYDPNGKFRNAYLDAHVFGEDS